MTAALTAAPAITVPAAVRVVLFRNCRLVTLFSVINALQDEVTTGTTPECVTLGFCCQYNGKAGCGSVAWTRVTERPARSMWLATRDSLCESRVASHMLRARLCNATPAQMESECQAFSILQNAVGLAGRLRCLNEVIGRGGIELKHVVVTRDDQFCSDLACQLDGLGSGKVPRNPATCVPGR